jgi:RNA polymerase sigma-70 factor (ECF subfamily)
MPLDAAQLADLIDAQAATLRLWVRSRCASPEDAVQEAFCRLASQEPPPDNPVAWLYQVCRNLADKQRRSDERRKSRETVHAQRTYAKTNPADPLELAETVAAVEQLDPNLQEVLIARIWGGLSLEDIAKLCGISAATACRRYQAALTALQTKLKLPTRNRNAR